jgi:hypothetical protein
VVASLAAGAGPNSGTDFSPSPTSAQSTGTCLTFADAVIKSFEIPGWWGISPNRITG